MNQSFIIGQQYPRSELLMFVGSRQKQSGIIWGPKGAGVVICTSGGRSGKKAGYEDCRNSDGTWNYFGQGENGDQLPTVFANKLLIEGKHSVLLFKAEEPNAARVRATGNWKKAYEYIGEYCVGSWDLIIPEEGRRSRERLIKFVLVPIDNSMTWPSGGIHFPAQGEKNSLQHLKVQLQSLGTIPRKGIYSSYDYYLRNNLLKCYAKQRAFGVCEYCGKDGPFLTDENERYLEVHHILRLADDGPDAPENVACLCPNCHRHAHYGKNKAEVQQTLLASIKQKEKLIRLT